RRESAGGALRAGRRPRRGDRLGAVDAEPERARSHRRRLRPDPRPDRLGPQNPHSAYLRTRARVERGIGFQSCRSVGRIGILRHVSHNDAMELHWRTNEGVSLFHAVDQVRRGYALGATNLAQALAEPTAKLVASVKEERLVPELFWRHLVPLAAEFDNPRQLAEVLLVKLQGRTEARVRIPRFTRNFTALRAAYDQAAPSLEESAAQIEALKQIWAQQGAGLLAGLKTWTDDAILVAEAIVYVVPPVTPGGGWMHLPYNSVRIEPVPDREGEVSEVLRLAWLLAPLNLDMPAYSEAIIA